MTGRHEKNCSIPQYRISEYPGRCDVSIAYLRNNWILRLNLSLDAKAKPYPTFMTYTIHLKLFQGQ